MQGKFYTGSTADMSDMREVRGAYISPDGKSWSSNPFEIRPIDKHAWWYELDLQKEHNLILSKQSTLSRAQREMVIEFYNSQNEPKQP